MPELNLSAVGISFEELGNCVRSDICMIWQRIAQKHDNELTPANQTIKRRFREIAEG